MSSVGRECAACGQSDGVHMSDCHLLHTALRGQTFQFPNQAEIERLQKVVADLEGDKATWKTVVDSIRDECDPVLLAECEGYVFRCVAKMREQIGTLKDGIAAQATVIRDMGLENSQLQALLNDERSLTAATAAHTTALELKVAELQAKWTEQRWPTWDEACHILMDVHGPETAVYQAARVLLERVVELEFPKPGATP